MSYFSRLILAKLHLWLTRKPVLLISIISGLAYHYATSQTALWPHGIGVLVDTNFAAIHIIDTAGMDDDLILESNNDQFIGSALLSLWRNSPEGANEPVTNWQELGFMRFYIPLLGSFDQIALIGASGRVTDPMDRGRGTLYFGTAKDENLDFVLSLDSNSNVGLRTPIIRYDVDLACDNVRPGSSANTWGGLNLQNPGSAGDWTFFPTKYSDPFITQDRFTLYLDNILVGFFRSDGSWFAASDRRLKKSIQPIAESETGKLLKLRPKRYRLRRSSTNRTNVGFIAQQLEKLYPDLVQKQEGNPHKSINYYGLLPYLIKGMQEMDQVNCEIEKQMDALLSSLEHGKQ